MHLPNKLRTLLDPENRIRLIVLLGAAGIALILLSGLLPKRQTETPRAEPPPAASGCTDPETYRIGLEERLTDLLSHMDGVGAVQVMITVRDSGEQVYASEISNSVSDRGTQTSASPVLIRTNGSESALLTESRSPGIEGAAILCAGGSHAAIQERVTKAASALLGIPVSSVYVGALNSVSPADSYKSEHKQPKGAKP